MASLESREISARHSPVPDLRPNRQCGSKMQTDNEAEALCRRIYIKTKDLYETIPDGPEKLGFQILYGPPFREAPIMFIHCCPN